MKEPVDHILRRRVPWRKEDAHSLTECGYNSAKVSCMSSAEYEKRERELGRQRAAMITCMTCVDALRRWGRVADDVRSVIGREIEWERGSGYIYMRAREDRGTLLHDELTALTKLAETHKEEFQGIIEEIQKRREWTDAKDNLKKKKRASTFVPRIIL